MRPVQFFADGLESPRAREDVRLKQLGLFVHEDGRRIAVGFSLTPFQHRPSLDVTVRNERGERAGALTVIEALSPQFTLTLHLRDKDPTNEYQVDVVVYYGGHDEERMEVDRVGATVDLRQPGETIISGDRD